MKRLGGSGKRFHCCLEIVRRKIRGFHGKIDQVQGQEVVT